MLPLYPWLLMPWQKIQHLKQQQHLPHALLLTGQQGIGKQSFAQHLAHSLLCQHPTMEGFACGQCHACQLLTSQNHPDLKIITPANNKKQILIDEIRSLMHFSSLTAHYSGYQIIMIYPMEAMNHYAANSVLKLLEEPPPSTYFILCSHQPERLLPTVRSRCQKLDLSPHDQHSMYTWLQQYVNEEASSRLLLTLTDYAPLNALHLWEQDGLRQRQKLFTDWAALCQGKFSAISFAEQWAKYDEVVHIVQWLISWLVDLIRYQCSANSTHMANYDYCTQLEKMAGTYALERLFKLWQAHLEAYRSVQLNLPIRPQNILENLALLWIPHPTQMN